MAPQHTLTTAPGLTGWTTESISANSNHPLAFWWANMHPRNRQTAGNANHGEAWRVRGLRHHQPESFNPEQFDSVKYLAAEANDWLDREFWSPRPRATPDHTADTNDVITAILAEIRTFWQTHWHPAPRVGLDCYGQPEAATTTQTALHVGKDGVTRPPESYPPSYFPEWLDIRFFGFDWID